MSPSPSTWKPLQARPYRLLWLGGSAYFLGNAMLSMAASWLMIELTGSSFLAALVQTASFLPMFLLSLPAGVMADTADRRRIILRSLGVYSVTALLLAAISLAGLAGPGTLLTLTFVMGCCTALQSPAWNSAVVDTVDRSDLPQAITLTAMSYNAARAVGPAIAGVLFAWIGSPLVFALAIATGLAMLQSIRLAPPAPHPTAKLPPERMWGGILSALRFARHSQAILAQLIRTVAFSGIGSALWSLLPAIALQLGLGAAGYGFLLGCLGVGAVTAGFFIARVRGRFGLELMVAASCAIFGVAMLVAGWSPWKLPVYLTLVCGGAAWMAVMSTLNAATQTSAPQWVRARAASLHTLSALGSFALGAAFWGALSAVFGLTATLSLAAAAMLASMALSRHFTLRMGEDKDVTQATPWEDLFVVEEPAPGSGPVAVEIVYRIEAAQATRFLAALELLRAPRRRDGATFWRVYRDLSNPARYVERFIVDSWVDYLRQRARATLADRDLEAQVRAFHTGPEPIAVQHYIAER